MLSDFLFFLEDISYPDSSRNVMYACICMLSVHLGMNLSNWGPTFMNLGETEHINGQSVVGIRGPQFCVDHAFS